MDKKEKSMKRMKLSNNVEFGNRRLKDDELELIEYLVDNRQKLNGIQKTRTWKDRGQDSKGRYWVDNSETLTFLVGDDDKIYIDRYLEEHWDDGQINKMPQKIRDVRGILTHIGKIIDL